MSWLRLVPVLVLGLLAGLLAFALLTRTNSNQTDHLIGEPVPQFSLAVPDGRPGFSPSSLEGGAYLLNVWGSWCPPCEAEHPFLMELRAEGVPIYGLAWRDSSETANAFLNRLGNPFAGVALDPMGEIVIALGVTGAPETFVVDSRGIIRARWAGPLTRQIFDRELRPALEAG
ncbi:DsbE family thiol:disulfide interchange protein [Hyphobacterium sp. HN65]|uniref:DsbE family thiol:disulfide interchange protein n=1 Tax=Hyphobacterium lacteum TaxID=3116575 RepID=A0ABU7LS59_9PROT|nr:DsbE family thiol:disulfide interchange protein [Hyphobacterium sp. HN65]MEE2526752.1 DsbE family thiol:disulfide interchange protein [Hyphobacterium sp. HN65]